MRSPAGASRRRAAGFTLPEVLAAISVLGISVLGVQGMFLGLAETATANAHYAVATELAQAELEDLRALHYGEIQSRSGMQTVNGIDYAIASVVSADVPQPEMKHVATTVSWTGHGGVGRQFSLETIYAAIRP